jgi:DNA-binding GntR family transcriptional regulator
MNAADRIASTLRARILGGTLAPGVQLREQELAAAHDTSRHTLRTAFRQLEHDGLVRLVPNRGAFVQRLGPEDVVDHYRLRTAVECEAARVVVTEDRSRQPLDEALASLRALPTDAPWSTVVEHDLAFHRALVAAAGSPRLARAFTALEGELGLLLADQRAYYVADRDMLLALHERVRDGLRADDPDAAASAVREHLDGSRAESLDALQA